MSLHVHYGYPQWRALAALKLASANSAAKNALADALAPVISFQIYILALAEIPLIFSKVVAANAKNQITVI